jgi:hypothetical protein
MQNCENLFDLCLIRLQISTVDNQQEARLPTNSFAARLGFKRYSLGSSQYDKIKHMRLESGGQDGLSRSH